MDDDIAIAIPTERSAMTGRPTAMTIRTTTRRRDVQGQVYLLHFEVAYRHAQHCLGWTEDIATRLKDHRRGRGARLMEVIIAAGIRFTLARTWPGTRTLERRLRTGAATPGSARSAKRANSAGRQPWPGKAEGRAIVSPLVAQRADAARRPTR